MKFERSSILVVFLIGLLFLGLAGNVAQAQAGTTEKEALIELFSSQIGQREKLFAESFLNQVSIDQINNIIARYKGKLGELKEVEGGKGKYTLVFERGTAPNQISLDEEGKIAGLWFGNWTLKGDTLDKIVSELKGVGGSASLYISKDDQKLYSLNGEKKMAVGSSFKLYVLKALYEKLGSEGWNRVLNLEEENISLPSGILQDWPVGTPVTVKTLSNLMISRSDNTATDQLIDFVGRDYMEEKAGPENEPFLTTAESFHLKYGLDEDKQKEYLNADTEEKREILEDFQKLQIDASRISTDTPVMIEDIEWFFSTRQLASVIYDLRDAEEIYINPGLADKSDWYRVGYKGGSEGGVLQYTHLLQKKEGSPIYAVSLTVNNPEKGVTNDKIKEIASRLISLVKDEKI